MTLTSWPILVYCGRSRWSEVNFIVVQRNFILTLDIFAWPENIFCGFWTHLKAHMHLMLKTERLRFTGRLFLAHVLRCIMIQNRQLSTCKMKCFYVKCLFGGPSYISFITSWCTNHHWLPPLAGPVYDTGRDQVPLPEV